MSTRQETGFPYKTPKLPGLIMNKASTSLVVPRSSVILLPVIPFIFLPLTSFLTEYKDIIYNMFVCIFEVITRHPNVNLAMLFRIELKCILNFLISNALLVVTCNTERFFSFTYFIFPVYLLHYFLWSSINLTNQSF